MTALFDSGKIFPNSSFAVWVKLSGNWTSNSTIKSPRFDGCFDNGNPWPGIRLVHLGFMTSLIGNGMDKPGVKVGT
uniref:Uncharacterized protein n=1 Tax=Romanomermis culicivorax TaxID=13658 RepID=A0A915HPE1_ROMCU